MKLCLINKIFWMSRPSCSRSRVDGAKECIGGFCCLECTTCHRSTEVCRCCKTCFKEERQCMCCRNCGDIEDKCQCVPCKGCGYKENECECAFHLEE